MEFKRLISNCIVLVLACFTLHAAATILSATYNFDNATGAAVRTTADGNFTASTTNDSGMTVSGDQVFINDSSTTGGTHTFSIAAANSSERFFLSSVVLTEFPAGATFTGNVVIAGTNPEGTNPSHTFAASSLPSNFTAGTTIDLTGTNFASLNVNEFSITYQPDGSPDSFGMQNFTVVVDATPTISNLNGDSVAYSIGQSAVNLDVGSNAAVADADENFTGTRSFLSGSNDGLAVNDAISVFRATTANPDGMDFVDNDVYINDDSFSTSPQSFTVGLQSGANVAGFVLTLVQFVETEASDTQNGDYTITGVPLGGGSNIVETVNASTFAGDMRSANGGNNIDLSSTDFASTTITSFAIGWTPDGNDEVFDFGIGNFNVSYDTNGRYNGGTFSVAIASAASDEDLIINEGSGVTLSAGMTVGSQVTVGSTLIGTIASGADGQNGNDLSVSLNANASGSSISILTQNIQYQNTSTSGARTVNFTVSDSRSTSTTSAVTLTASASNDSDGSLTASATVSEPVGIDTTIDSIGEAVDVFDFTLTDGGTSDGLAMEVTEVRVNVTGTTSDADRNKVTWRLNGPDVSNVSGSYSSGVITFNSFTISVSDGASETYTVNAFFNDNTGLTEDNTFILSVDGDTDLTIGASGTQMGTTSAVTSGAGGTYDVIATALGFTTQPSGSVSGVNLTTQPVVEALDAFGNTDIDFTETITLTEASAGTLSGGSIAAISGVATFTALNYTATADGELFTLTANDQDGVGTDLSTVNANAVASDVVATALVFDTQPVPTSISSGVTQDFTTDPVVHAVDADGTLDTGYSTDVTLSIVDTGGTSLTGGHSINSFSSTADPDSGGETEVTGATSSGVATFAGLALQYTVSGSSDVVDIRATSGSLTAANSSAITASTNNAPAVDLNGGGAGENNTASFTESAGAVAIAPAATVADDDADTITNITVTVTNDQDGASEGLNVTAAQQDALGGISGSSDISLQDTISITSATASVAEVQTFLRSITYNNVADTPSITDRTITVVINDGTDNSTSRTSTVSVAAVTSDTTTGSFDTTTGSGLTNGLVFDGSDESLIIANASHIDASAVANGQGGTDTFIVAAGISADLSTSGFALSNFENLTLNDGASATMTEAQHDTFSANAISAGAGTETITLATAADASATGDGDIEAYILNDAYTFTLGATGQDVTGSDADSQTINIGALSLTALSDLDGGTGQTDVLQMANGASISSAGSIAGFESVDVTGSVTMTEAQHDGFTSGVTAAGVSDQITLSSADGDSAVSTDADVETYVLNTAFTATLGTDSGHLGQNITGSSGDDSVVLGSGTYTGTLNAAGGTGDTLSLVNGSDTSGATVSNFENLTLASGATVTLSTGSLASFSGTITAPGAETVNVSGDGNYTTLANIENWQVGDDSTNTRTITLSSDVTSITANTTNDGITFNVGTQTLTGTLTGNNTVADTLQLGNGANTSTATIANITNLTIDSGASVTLTEAQHDSFASGFTASGTQQITVSPANDGFTADSNVETYVLGVANSVTLGTSGGSLGQNISGSSGNDTFILGAATYTGTLNAAGGTGDTLNVTDGTSIAGATVSNIENLTIASGGTLTLTSSQLPQFTGTVTAAGSETLNVNGDGNFSTLNNAAIEVYIAGDDSTNTRTITLGSNDTGTNISASSSSDAITFSVPNITYTGTLTGEGTTNDTLSLADGADTSGATLSNIEVLALASGAEVTISAGQYQSFSGQTITAAGTGASGETINISGTGDITINGTTVENYALNDDSSDSRTVTLGASNSNAFIASSTSDAITLDVTTFDFSGSFNANTTVANTLVSDGSNDIGSATLTGFTNLTLDGATNDLSLTASQLNSFSGTITGSGTDTLRLISTGTLTGGNLSAIETFATGTGGSITVTIPAADVSGKTLEATTSASDSFTITGSDGAQTINGSAGGDNLAGGNGTDTLSPGAGTDSLTGGADNDVFSGSSADLNGDTITDLAAGDTIKINGVSGLTTSNVRFNGSGTLQIDTDSTDFSSVEVSITLSNSAGDDLNILAVTDNGGDTDITFEDSNDLAVFSNLSASNPIAYTENASPITIDDDVTIFDADLDANSDNYTGSSLTISRNGGANANDVFSADGTSLLTSLNSGTLTFNGTSYGTITNSSGTLTLSFSSNTPSVAVIASIMQAIQYSNSSDAPSTSITLDWVFNDGVANSTVTTSSQALINVTEVNDAPVLNAAVSPALLAIDEDAGDDDGDSADNDDDGSNNTNNAGTDIATIVVDSSITDPDGSAVEAIAVVSVDNTNGIWQYSTDNGTNWVDFTASTGDVDLSTSARLLDGTLSGANTHKVRYVPAANYSGTTTFTMRAWDKSTGSAGSTADTSATGDTTAFSVNSDTASITVNSINDAPVLSTNTGVTVERGTSITITNTALETSDEEDDADNITYTLTQTPAVGALQKSDGSTFSNLAVNETFTQGDINNSRLRYVHAGDVNTSDSFNFNVSDQDSGTLSAQVFNIGIQDTVAPTITNVAINNTAHKVGDTVTATITVATDSDNYTTGTGGISGTIAGYSVGGLTRQSDSTYTATFTISDGGTDFAASSDIPVSISLTDSSGNSSSVFSTAISQAGDAIYANRPDVVLSTDNSTIAEDGGVATVTVSLSGSLNNQWPEDVGVSLSFSGTATNVTDYTRSSTSATISANTSSDTVTVTAVGDDIYDALSNETVLVNIDCIITSSVSIGAGQQQTITITDAETAPTVTLSVDNTTIPEDGSTSALSTATLSNQTFGDVVVALSYSGTATSGDDFNNTVSTSITVPAGQTVANAGTSITAVQDSDSEDDETVEVAIDSVSGGGATESGTQSIEVTIEDDDNSAPEVANTPAALTITEDEVTNLNLADITFTDAQDDNLIVTLAVDSGILSSPLGTSGNVVVGNAGTASMTLTGAPDDITIFFDNATAVAVTPVADSTSAITLTITPNDGSINGTAQEATISINAVDDAPQFDSVAITAATEDSAYEYDVRISDVDTTDANLSLTLGANAPSWLSLTTGTSTSIFAGTGQTPTNNGGLYDSPDNTLATDSLMQIMSMSAGPNGTVYYFEQEEYGIRYVDTDGRIQTFFAGDGNSSTLQSTAIAYDSTNDQVYTSFFQENKVEVIDASGNRSDVATGITQFPSSMLLDTDNNKLYVGTRSAIYEIDLTDTNPATSATRIIGDGAFTGSYADTGVASTSLVNQVSGLAIDANGDLLFTEQNNYIVRRIDIANDTITTVAGTQGVRALAGDGGSASAATFDNPTGIVIDSAGNIYISERVERVVRRIDTNGDIGQFFDATGLGSGFWNSLDIGSDGTIYVNSSTTIGRVGQVNRLSGTPQNENVGDNAVCLELTDGNSDVEQCFTIAVTNTNDAPTVDTNAGVTLDEGARAVIGTSQLSAADVDDDADGITFTVTTTVANGTLFLDANNNDAADSGEQLTANSTFTQADIASDNLQYVHDDSETLTDSFVFSVADGGEDGVSALTGQTFNITVNSVNEAPSFSSSPVTQASEDSAYSYAALANDPDTGESLTYTLTTNPGWLSVNASTGLISGTPSNLNVGVNSVVLVVTDSGNLTDTQSFTITVANTNDAPVISSTAITSVSEDDAYVYTISASDVDAGDSLTYSAPTLASWMTFNSTTRTLSGTPTNSAVGNHPVTLQVSDNSGATDSQSFTVTVTNTNDAPVIDSTAVTAVSEDEAYSYTVTASDVDIGDSLTYSAPTLPAWITFDSSSRTLSGTPSNADVGNHDVTVQVADTSGATDAQSFTVVVSNTNDAPVISGTPTISVNEGSAYSFTPEASDDDGDNLTFSIVNAPSWTAFSSATGTLTGTPTNSDVGVTTDIVISVSDGVESASLAPFTLTVENVNDAPSGESLSVEVLEDEGISISPRIEDIDSDELTINVVQSPQNGTVNLSGLGFFYQPSSNFNGDDSFTYSVSDGELTSDVFTIDITVVAQNDAPVAEDDSFTLTANATGIYALNVLANDFDVDEDVLTLVAADTEFGSITIQNSSLSLNVGENFSGTLSVSYSIDDGNDASDTAEVAVVIEAQDSNTAPVLTIPDDVIVNATGLLTRVDLGVATAVDPSSGNPLAVVLDGNRVRYAPGRHNVVWSATSSSGEQASQSQRIDVLPLISFSEDESVKEGSQVAIQLLLNGTSPVYPVIIPITVAGDAELDVDYSLSTQEVRIESGVSATVLVDIFDDAEEETPESIVLAMGGNQNQGAKNTLRLTITPENVSPEVELSVTQDGDTRLTVERIGGSVIVDAIATDADVGDTLSYEWVSEQGVSNQSDTEALFEFAPNTLDVGVYTFTVTVSDDAPEPLAVTAQVFVELVDSLQPLDSTDTDGDLIPDDQEGYQDSDNDGIPDYQDAINECNVVPEQLNNQETFLVEGDPGTCLRRGVTSITSELGGLQLTQNEVDAIFGSDDNADNIGGLFDFYVTGLPELGQSVSIVFPQIQPVPVGAVYRKFRSGEWVDYVVDENNTVRSVLGEEGVCPPPGDEQYQSGLIEGAWCVEITIEDGGPNDDDNLINGAILDPGGVAVPVSDNSQPVTENDSVTLIFNTTVTISVLDNDSDPDGDVLTVITASADFGDVIINADNTLTYTPNTNYAGEDVIRYVVVDGNGGTANAQVEVTVLPNRVPILNDDTAFTIHTQPIEIDVIANDTDEDGDTLSIIGANADVGEVMITANNTLRYTPQLLFDGIATLSYTVSDGFNTATAMVSVTVNGNQNPVAEADTARTDDRSAIVLDVLANDSDADGDTLTITDASAQQGTVTIISNGAQLSYVPQTGFDGVDIVTYMIDDGNGGTATGTVQVTVDGFERITVTNESSGGAMSLLTYWLLLLAAGWRVSARRPKI